MITARSLRHREQLHCSKTAAVFSSPINLSKQVFVLPDCKYICYFCAQNYYSYLLKTASGIYRLLNEAFTLGQIYENLRPQR